MLDLRAQLYLTLCEPQNYSLPDSLVHGIFQARILEWVALSSSRAFSGPKDFTRVSFVSCIGRWILHHLHHLARPYIRQLLAIKCSIRTGFQYQMTYRSIQTYFQIAIELSG